MYSVYQAINKHEISYCLNMEGLDHIYGQFWQIWAVNHLCPSRLCLFIEQQHEVY